jgi:peroxiredoxin/uncharacterized membrane protein YphA (DoxX/SURF4 family)
MSVTAVVARMVLAVVFLVAALGKLGDRPGAQEMLTAFGVPRRLVRPLALLLPLAELAVAIALLPSSSARWGATGAIVLLAIFVVAIGLNLAHGRTPDCRCFGQLNPTAVGWRTLVRNVALAFLAGLVIWLAGKEPPPSAIAWMGEQRLGWMALAAGGTALALVVVAGQTILSLLRQQGRLLLRVDALEAALGHGHHEGFDHQPAGLPVGTPAPVFDLPTTSGGTLTLDRLRAATLPVLLVFADPDCRSCSELLPEVATWQAAHAGGLTVAVLSEGNLATNQALATAAGLGEVAIQRAREVADAFGVPATPSALVIGVDGRLASPVVSGAGAIRDLLARTVGIPVPMRIAVDRGKGGPANHPPVALPAPGEAAPRLVLPDLSGAEVDLASFSSETLVLFWNPSCGFCSDMLADLRAWERAPSSGAPRLVVVSTGSVEENRALGLRSTVLLDHDSKAMTAWGAHGTPVAVLVDAQGRIASRLAIGAKEVFSVARGEGKRPLLSTRR